MPRIDNKDIRTWLIFVLFTGALGFLNIGAPLDVVFSAVRAKVIQKNVSGDTVVVGIDDAALQSIGSWPWSGDQLVEFHDRLVEAGADRIVYTMPLADLSEEAAAAFASAMKTHDNRVYLSVTKEDFVGGERDIWPQTPLDAHANIVSVANYLRFWNGVEQLEYQTDYFDRPVAGLAAELSGMHGSVGRYSPVDYSFRVSGIPYVGAADIVDQRPDIDVVDGRDVLVGWNTSVLTSNYKVLGQTGAPPVFVHALGLETLTAGRPVNLGGWPLWAAACLFSLLVFRNINKRRSALVGNIAFGILLIAPVAFEPFQVNVQISSAFFILLLTAITVNRRQFADQQRSSASVNPISGLKTVNAVRHEDGSDERFVVAGCIRRFADILSALSQEGEKAIVKELVGRLELCTGQAELFQGEDGGFYWFVDAQNASDLNDQFRAMALIFRTPVTYGDQSFDINIAFGVDTETGLSVSKRFVNALSAAQDAQREEVLWKQHNPEESKERAWELTFRADLEVALENGEIWVAFQPQILLSTGELMGCEALVRWTHHSRGPISPQVFVDRAERSGCIDILTDFVLSRSLELAKQLEQQGHAVPVSVNLSPRLLEQADLAEKISTALQTHDLKESLLTLEITETRQIVYNADMKKQMMKLRGLGVGLSIDDYGTGMSTLEYLRQIPATELKIDRCFTSGICSNTQDRLLIKSTVELAHALDMFVVVEGVETLEVQELSRQMGADLAQGYGISRPLAYGDFINWVLNYTKIRSNFDKAC